MSDWFRHVSDAVYDALSAAMGLDPEVQSTLDRIVPAYVPGVTTPQYNSDDNVLFFALSEENPANSSYVTVRNDASSLHVTEVIPVSLLLTFYGPNADNDAAMVRRRLLIDTGAGSPRSLLRAQKIVFNYGLGRMPPVPSSVPELEGTLWRRRCDLRLSLSYLCTESLDVVPVEQVPEIKTYLADD